MAGVSQPGGLERPLYETVKVKPGLPWRLQDVGDARVMGGELLTGSGTSPRERSVLYPTKMSRVGDLKSALTSDMEMQFGVFPSIWFGVLLWSSISSLFSPIFWNGNEYPVALYVGSM